MLVITDEVCFFFQASAKIMTEELREKMSKKFLLRTFFQAEQFTARSKHFWLSSLTVLLYNT